MHQFPHTYPVSASAKSDSDVSLSAPGVVTISSAPPVEFDGPGDQWSPESLLVAAVADCFVLSFRAIARASKLEWSDLICEVEGVLDRTENGLLFTGFNVRARLIIDSENDLAKADKLLHKADQVCLITNSLIADSHIETEVLVSD